MGFTGSLRNTGLLLWKNTLLTIRRPVNSIKFYRYIITLTSSFIAGISRIWAPNSTETIRSSISSKIIFSTRLLWRSWVTNPFISHSLMRSNCLFICIYLHILEHFRPMALPSAGLLPFAQTLICDLSTTNSNFSADMPYFPNAKYIYLYSQQFTMVTHKLSLSVSQVYDLLGDTAIDEVATSFCDSLINIQSISSCRDPLLEKITNGQGQGTSKSQKLC